MSPRLRRLSGRDVVRILTDFGFEVVNTRGGHSKLRRTLPDGSRQTLTLPLHDELAPGTLHSIYRQSLRFIYAADLHPQLFAE